MKYGKRACRFRKYCFRLDQPAYIVKWLGQNPMGLRAAVASRRSSNLLKSMIAFIALIVMAFATYFPSSPLQFLRSTAELTYSCIVNLHALNHLLHPSFVLNVSLLCIISGAFLSPVRLRIPGQKLRSIKLFGAAFLTFFLTSNKALARQSPHGMCRCVSIVNFEDNVLSQEASPPCLS